MRNETCILIVSGSETYVATLVHSTPGSDHVIVQTPLMVTSNPDSGKLILSAPLWYKATSDRTFSFNKQAVTIMNPHEQIINMYIKIVELSIKNQQESQKKSEEDVSKTEDQPSE